METHSSILAREIPWAEEPGRLQSMGLQKVRHDLATKQQHGVLTQGALVVKNPPSNAGVGDAGLIPRSGRSFSPGEGNGNPLQYSCLENFEHYFTPIFCYNVYYITYNIIIAY